MKKLKQRQYNLEQDELNGLKTDIAVIKRDISQIEKFFLKLDKSIDIVSGLSKTNAVQEMRLTAHEKRLGDIDTKLTQYYRDEDKFRRDLQAQLTELKDATADAREVRHREVMESIKAMHEELKKDNTKRDTRINKLEELKWWSMGVGAALVAVGTFIWRTFFG
jgi:prefoldin subunit 5